MEEVKRKLKKHGERISGFAFFVGFVLAILAGLPGAIPVETRNVAVMLITIFGLIVGFLNIRDEEIKPFLIATIALAVSINVLSGLGNLPYIGAELNQILRYIGVFVAPAAIVVAIKEIYNIAQGRE